MQSIISKLNMRILLLALLVLAVFAVDSLIAPAPAVGQDKIVSPCQNPDYCSQNLGAYYDPKTCSCHCNSVCKCKNKLQQWSGYPTCQCLCKKKAKCSELQYWYSPRCTCKCKYQIICFNPAYVQDPQTCACVCKPAKCKYNQKQDPATCKCVPKCEKALYCRKGKNVNPELCKCK